MSETKVITKNGIRVVIMKKIDRIIQHLPEMTRNEIQTELIFLKRIVWNNIEDGIIKRKFENNTIPINISNQLSF